MQGLRLTHKKLAALVATISLIGINGSAQTSSGPALPVIVDEGFGEFVLVSQDEFLMGDNFNEGDADEVPVHRVVLDAFYIARYKVTNKDFWRFIEAGGYSEPSYWSAGGFGEYGELPRHWNSSRFHGGGIPGGGDFPVVGVSWFEAAAYCSWISSQTGQNYRLPTEAEWERAARADDQRRFPWGDSIDGSLANYEFSGGPYEPGLTPVGFYDGTVREGFKTGKNISPFGVVEMTGNVWEWCSDWYGGDFYSSSPTQSPTGPESGSSKVLRGGGWVDSHYYHRAANRNSSFPENRNPIQGFRCVRDQ
ncbi:MAG: formylglycine-generating enzyme family protein [bacterium]|nr:formylglycine-generating enzyme family protein [bacterium]